MRTPFKEDWQICLHWEPPFHKEWPRDSIPSAESIFFPKEHLTMYRGQTNSLYSCPPDKNFGDSNENLFYTPIYLLRKYMSINAFPVLLK